MAYFLMGVFVETVGWEMGDAGNTTFKRKNWLFCGAVYQSSPPWREYSPITEANTILLKKWQHIVNAYISTGSNAHSFGKLEKFRGIKVRYLQLFL